jgi:Zn finger protein HypA/HybF involved in hydrogenase expression
MHELSLAIEIGRLAEEKLGASVARCVAVGVDVGDDSGVEPSALEFCLEAVFSHPPWTGARAEITRPPGDVFQVTWFEIEDDDHDCPAH